MASQNRAHPHTLMAPDHSHKKALAHKRPPPPPPPPPPPHTHTHTHTHTPHPHPQMAPHLSPKQCALAWCTAERRNAHNWTETHNQHTVHTTEHTQKTTFTLTKHCLKKKIICTSKRGSHIPENGVLGCLLRNARLSADRLDCVAGHPRV